jgi:NAD(P)H-hydrate epimerase
MKTITPRDIKLIPRKRTSHKGQNGRVLVVGGSVDYVGAPTFVGQAALAVLRSGADLVTIAAPEKVAWAINRISPDLITRKLPGNWLVPKHLKTVLALSKQADVVVVGNGIGLRPQTKAFVRQLVKHVKKPLIIDADALKIVRLQEVKHAVLTPHGGEFGTLLKNSKLSGKTLKHRKSTSLYNWWFAVQTNLGGFPSVLKPKKTKGFLGPENASHFLGNRISGFGGNAEHAAGLFDRRFLTQLQPLLNDNVLVLKGHPNTRIIEKKRSAQNITGNAGMTHGGTGDVLAGIISGLMAQGNDPFMAACTACYVNGNAAELLYKKMGFGYLASDLVLMIPSVLKRFQKQV